MISGDLYGLTSTAMAGGPARGGRARGSMAGDGEGCWPRNRNLSTSS